MSNEPSTEPANTPEPTSTDTDADVDADEALDLVSYDLNDDGKISPLEGARAELVKGHDVQKVLLRPG